MVSFRAILLWLMMLAVPFQAYAAAVMTLCGPDARQPAQVSTLAVDDHHGSHAAAASDPHAGDMDEAHHHGDSANDPGHRCGNCAPCHGVGLTPAMATLAPHNLPQADLAEPLYPLATVSPSVPHKPPRA